MFKLVFFSILSAIWIVCVSGGTGPSDSLACCSAGNLCAPTVVGSLPQNCYRCTETGTGIVETDSLRHGYGIGHCHTQCPSVFSGSPTCSGPCSGTLPTDADPTCYNLCHDNGLCALTSTGSSYIINDPHFLGLNGHKYDFQGEPNKVFALISDSHVQVNSRFVDGGIKDKNNQSQTYLGDVCVRFCDSTAIFTTEGTVTLSGPVESNLVVERHANGSATVSVGLWSMLVETSGHSHHNLKNVKLQHPILAGPTHGVLGVTAPDRKEMFRRARNSTRTVLTPTASGMAKKEAHRTKFTPPATTPHPHCQAKSEGGCEVPGEWHEYEVEGNDLCGTKFKYSKFDQKKCSSIAVNLKRGIAEENLLLEAQLSILH